MIRSKQTKYVDKSVWINEPCASQAPENKPQGKNCQKFYFKKPWEPKHAIGKQHKKRLEFEATPGISAIYWSAHSGTFGCFIIQGKPNSVDQVMLEIGKWLDACQLMHARDIELIYF